MGQLLGESIGRVYIMLLDSVMELWIHTTTSGLGRFSVIDILQNVQNRIPQRLFSNVGIVVGTLGITPFGTLLTFKAGFVEIGFIDQNESLNGDQDLQ